jgi:hypothetical protein
VRTPTDAPHTFFIDRSPGAHDVPDALRAAGALVEIHDDHVAPDTPERHDRLCDGVADRAAVAERAKEGSARA